MNIKKIYKQGHKEDKIYAEKHYLKRFKEIYTSEIVRSLMMEVTRVKSLENEELKKTEITKLNNFLCYLKKDEKEVESKANEPKWLSRYKKNRKNEKNNLFYKKGKKFYQSEQWRTLRKIMLELFPHRCMKCKIKPYSLVDLHVDHVVSRYNESWNQLNINNLQLLCKTCNQEKGIDYADYRTPDQKALLENYKVDFKLEQVGESWSLVLFEHGEK